MFDTLSAAPFDGDTPENKTAWKGAVADSVAASNPAVYPAEVIL